MLFAVALLVSSCTQGRIAGRAGGTLTAAIPAVYGAIDPHRSVYATPLHTAVFDTLLSIADDGLPVPGLAKEWRVEADGRSVVLVLRGGVTFHDGTVLDGAAVVANLRRVVKGGPDLFPVAQLLGPVSDVSATGFTVTIEYGQRFPPVLAALADPRLAIMAPSTLAALDAGSAAAPLQAGDVLGCGPYRLAELDTTHYVLLPYAEYAWPPAGSGNPGAAYPERVNVNLFDGDSAVGQAITAGADLVWWPPTGSAGRTVIPRPDGWREYVTGGDTVMYMALSCTAGPLADRAVREAILALLPRAALAEQAGVQWVSTASLVAAGKPGAASVAVPTAKTEVAIRTLAGAGWRAGDDGMLQRDGEVLELRLATYEGDAWWAGLAAQVAETWRSVGIAVRLVAPRRTTPTGLVVDSANAWLLQYDWPDPDALYYLFHSDWVGDSNRAGYRSAATDELLATGRSTIDPVARAAAYRKADAQIRADAVATGVLRQAGAIWTSPRLAGVRPPVGTRFEWIDVYLRPD